MKNLLLSLLLLPLLAFGAAPGDLVEGKWVNITIPSGTGSTIRSVWPNTGSAAVKDVKNVMAYSGGAFATGYGTRGSLLVWGGGHGDYAGNEVYRFDIEQGRWYMTGSPSPTSVCNYATSQYADGKPCSAHTYDATEYSPLTNELFKIGPASDYSVGGGGTGNIDAFQLSSSTWTRKGRLATFTDVCGVGAGEGSTTAWDSVNQVLWWHGGNKYVSCGGGASQGNQLQKINPTTGATIASYAGANPGIDGVMGFAPELKALILLDTRSAKELNVWDVSTGTPVRYLNVAYTGTFPDDSWGFDWDPIALKGVAYSGAGSTVTTLTPPANWATAHTGTWTFATVSAGSGSAVPTQTAPYTWTFGRFRYVPSICGFVISSGVDFPVYAYRLTGGAGPGCGGSPPVDPPPAALMSATASSINTGGSTTLSWATSEAGACTASASPAVTGWSGSKALTGTLAVSPTATAVFTLDCTGLLSQVATHAIATTTVIVNTGTGGTGDFATRCAAAGVKRCTSFDTDADFTRNVLLFPDDFNRFQGTRDTAVKSSGASSLRFNVPVDSRANTSGYWRAPLWDTTYVHPVSGVVGGTSSAHFVPGETLYWQYRQRLDSDMANPNTFNTSGWKQWILHPASGPSCIGYQVVQVNQYLRGFTQMYASCGGNHIEVNLPDGDIRLQQGDVDCRYRNQTGCKRYTADTWITYYYKFTLGAYGTPTTRIEAWTGNEGEAPVKFMDYPSLNLPQELGGDGLSRIQLTPYQTGKTTDSAANATIWYDDLIVSTQPIAWPSGGSASPPPTVALNATPATIASGAISTLDWTSTNATTCDASGAWAGTRATSGQQDTPALTTSQVYTLTCSGTGGTSPASTATVTVTAAPPVVTITANPTSVVAGEALTLTWNVTGATSCLASGGWSGIKNPVSGRQLTSALSATTSFTLACTGAGGSGSGVVTVNVTTPQPTVVLTASPNPVDYGARTTLTKTVTNSTSCAWTAGQPAGTTATGGTQLSIVLLTATTFTIRCDNAAGSAQSSVTVGVNPILNASVTLTAEPPTITAGGTSRLTWVTTNANACTGTGGTFAGARTAGGGFLDVTPAATTGYGITCTAAAGSPATAAFQVIVNSVIPDPLVFLQASQLQIPSGTSTLLNWQVSDATACNASGDWSGAKDPSPGSVHSESTGNLTVSKTYRLDCTNAGSGTGNSTTSVTITAAPILPNVNIFATPLTIAAGDPVTVTWSSTNATSCSGSVASNDPDWLSATSISGTRVLYPTSNTTYVQTCTNAVNQDSSSVNVTVGAGRTLTLTALPAIAYVGGSTTLTWATGGPLDACIWLQGPFTGTIVAADGSVSTGNLNAPTTFKLMCLVASEVLVGFGPYPELNPAFKFATLTVNVTPNTPKKSRRFYWRRRR